MVELTLVLGSTSDWKDEVINKVKEATLSRVDLSVKVVFGSVHNTPKRVPRLMADNTRVSLGGAGMSAALPGIMEAHYFAGKLLNVGVPVRDNAWGGLSAFLSISEMPPNNPVICTGINNFMSAVHIGYCLNQNTYDRVVIAHMGSGSAKDGAEKLKGKLEGLIGEGSEKIFYAGNVSYTRPSDVMPEEMRGGLVISVHETPGLTKNGAFNEIDALLYETEGIHLAVLNPDSNYELAQHASLYARQFESCKATGTLAVGGAGITNAAQAAARIILDQGGIDKIIETKNKKAGALENSPTYIVESGTVREAE